LPFEAKPEVDQNRKNREHQADDAIGQQLARHAWPDHLDAPIVDVGAERTANFSDRLLLCDLSARLFGVFANIAVAINVAMIFGVLSLLNATLTLPGIAGIVLTVGIAVDSNVLIYERIREEVRGGRTPINAIDAGFSRALATILDSNITTFIAAAVLFYIGTGPVRGFAVTLGIGIITTVFTAFTLTRLIVAYWVRWRRPQRVPI